jgi:hypothetical protein
MTAARQPPGAACHNVPPEKVARMADWGAFCAERGIHYHVARVNSIKRMALAASCGAHSVDGSSASRYAVTLPRMAYAARQPDLWAPQ